MRTDGRQRDLTPEERRSLVPVPMIVRPTRREVTHHYRAEMRGQHVAPDHVRAEYWRITGGAGVAKRNARADNKEYLVKVSAPARGAAVSGTGKPKEK